MSREWKPRPGAVCLVRYADSDGPWVVGIATTPYGNWRTQEHGATRRIAEARPLVVIDPEDREQVALLLAHYHDWKWTAEAAEASIPDMQAALRSLIADPKPDEPQGLGAVVEAIYGNQFVHIGGGLWQRVGDGTDKPCHYTDVAAVRVLSEGIKP